MSVTVTKIAIVAKAEAQHVVYGWGNVSVVDGALVTDLQGDQIPPEELEAAVMAFMLGPDDAGDGVEGPRRVGVMHEGKPVGRVFASFVTTADVVKAYFGDSGKDLPVGWMLGVHVDDAKAWQQVVDGTLKAFSIQGTADRVPV
jgi:hypothetical protein